MILIPILLIFGGYFAFSIFLFFFPTILHKPKYYIHPIFYRALYGHTILRIAHRGGPRYGTQNTIQTFNKNIQHSDMIEFDVCETKDGIMVVHHDQDLQRTCGIKKHVKQYNYEQLPPFKQQIQLNFAGKGHVIRSNGQKIPTLQQIFINYPKILMNIQIKQATMNGINKTIELVKKYNRQRTTIIGVRNQLQSNLKQLNTKGLTFMNDSQFYKILAAYITGFLPYIYIQQATFQIPLFTQQFYQWKLRQNNHWKTHIFFISMKIMNILIIPLIYHLKQRGIMTYYWVCNCQSDINRAIRYGACGIMTDDPPLLSKIVQSRYKYRSQDDQIHLDNMQKHLPQTNIKQKKQQ